METKLRILIAEDVPFDAELAERELKKVVDNYELQVVDSEVDFRHALKHFKPDLILSDYHMPTFDGLSALKIKLEKSPFTPFIIVTGSVNEDTAVECMKAGADNYVIKEHIKRLCPAILGALEKKKIEKERFQALVAQQASENKYKDLYENAPNAYFTVEKKGYITMCNQRAGELLGFAVEELLKQHVLNLYGDCEHGKEKAGNIMKQVRQGKNIESEELQMRRKDGALVWINLTVNAITDKQGRFVESRSIVVDINERKNAEEEIKRNLQEKTILLSEIHHRVKNSLQVVASLLQLQSRKVKDENVIDLFTQSRNRIVAMASVYERLYQSKNFASIDFNEYLEDVLNKMYRFSGLTHRVSLKMDIINVILGLDDAIPAALILNELFTNSMKYAFPDNREGAIEISFSLLDEETYQLIYKDNGVGLVKNIDFETTDTLGLHLVKMLAEQIEGQATLQQNEWTTFKITFKGYGHAKKKYSHS
jgi:PAS domain S-box-containing protein